MPVRTECSQPKTISINDWVQLQHLKDVKRVGRVISASHFVSNAYGIEVVYLIQFTDTPWPAQCRAEALVRVCGNCHRLPVDHAESGQCLYAPGKFT
jgi:hypothetical protein